MKEIARAVAATWPNDARHILVVWFYNKSLCTRLTPHGFDGARQSIAMEIGMYDKFDQAWQELTAKGAPFETETITLWGREQVLSFKSGPRDMRAVWLLSKEHADQDYLVYNQERLTYRQAHAQVASIANWLQAQGVGVGDRVAIAMRNYPEWMLAYWATVALGATLVGLNAWWIDLELLYALDDAKPKVLICDQERLERFWRNHEKYPDMRTVVVRGRGNMPEWTVDWIDLISAGGELPEVEIDPDSDAAIFYTSGTAGATKGAQLTHRGCTANLLNMVFNTRCGARMLELQGVEMPPPESMPPTSALVTTPLFHVTAINCVTHAVTLQGGKLVLMYRWDAEHALQLVEQEKISNLSGVPVMARELIAHPDFSKTDTSSLLVLGGGGAALQPDLVGKIDQAVATARPGTGYGMTEVCGVISTIAGDLFVDKPASCGRPVPNLASKIVDESGAEVPPGETGELWVKGSSVIRGYLNQPEASAAAIIDGWLRTGDLARIDEQGFLYIMDRKKDMVLRGGENVYCAEVENAIFAHQEVIECAVFGVPDERLGEEVAAAIVVAAGCSLDANAMRVHCNELLAPFKIPRYIWLLTELLPRNASGKFLKRELQKTLAIEAAA